MTTGLSRPKELLEARAVDHLRQYLLAAGAGLLTAGPLGLLGSLLAFNRVRGNWLPWALIGVLAAPPLAYGQLLLLQRWQGGGEPIATGGSPEAEQLISEADRVARVCAEALRTTAPGVTIRNPIDGSELSCDRSYPSMVVITSKRFAPLAQEQLCGTSVLKPGTTAIQMQVSPAGLLACSGIERGQQWFAVSDGLSRQQLYRHCTDNLRLEARFNFEKSAVQLGRPDYCAEERALLARDLVTGSL
jgi:hypothetical protein